VVISFISWFYGEIPKRIWFYFKVWFLHLTDLFSVGILLRTFFSPWKRDVISTRGLPLNARFNVWLMNLVSRGIGAFIKGCSLLAFLFSTVGWLASFLLFFWGWLVFPIIFIVVIFGYPNWINLLPYG
jgi:hypothetical protein